MTDRPLGPLQIRRLTLLGPQHVQVVGTRVTLSLARRGLVECDDDGGMAGLTPSGLRALADLIDQGRVQSPRAQALHEAFVYRSEGRRP